MLKEIILKHLNKELSNQELELFDLYYETLVSYNEHTNLTRITSRQDADIKHFLDSLLLSKLYPLDHPYRFCDMGAGAGFPSIPLLICYPNLRVVIVESQIKRVNFLLHLKKVLNLDFEVVHERAEVYAQNHLETFDIVTARALGELRLILEFGVPLLKVGGYFIAPKGSKYQEELDQAKEALRKLHMKQISSMEVELPDESGFRMNLLFQKEKHASGYPRPYAVMIKKPL